MSRGYIEGYSRYEYHEARKRGDKAAKVAANYREKYLALRKMMREYVKDNDLEISEEMKKEIGLK